MRTVQPDGYVFPIPERDDEENHVYAIRLNGTDGYIEILS